ncbi:hypothetical protein XENORESO_009327 [Xenotaenia resolanae]|uniref:Uncharacterized protein n=1 Tax=Xenotaenia resolanae TaxID=208358 RepID=A0ABV0WA56_9TELE
MFCFIALFYIYPTEEKHRLFGNSSPFPTWTSFCLLKALTNIPSKRVQQCSQLSLCFNFTMRTNLKDVPSVANECIYEWIWKAESHKIKLALRLSPQEQQPPCFLLQKSQREPNVDTHWTRVGSTIFLCISQASLLWAMTKPQ